MNYQPEVRRSLRRSRRKRTRSSYEDRSSEASEDTGRTSRSKTSLRNQEEEEDIEKKNFYKDFTCAICLETLTDPHLLPDCCHRFCGGCIKESIAKGNMTPSCRERITTKRCLRKDDLMEKLLIRIQRLEDENAHLKRALETKQDEFGEDENEEYDGFCQDESEEDDATEAPTRKKQKVSKTHEKMFDKRFNDLQEFKSKHGHCNVPYAYKDNDNLGHWIQHIRRMKSGADRNIGVYQLTEERINKLENIGFKWKAPRRTFDDRFNALQEFKSKHGHCNVPYAYKGNDNLGCWVSRIRGIKAGSRDNSGVYQLTKERIKKLDYIEFRWKI